MATKKISKRYRGDDANLEELRNAAALSTVLTKVGRVFADTDQLTVAFDAKGLESEGIAAVYDGGRIVLGEMIKQNIGNEAGLTIAKGAFYHELSHILYTPTIEEYQRHWEDYRTNQAVMSDGRDARFAMTWTQAQRVMNALEDGRIETLFAATHQSVTPYFAASATKWVVNGVHEGNILTALPLVIGRKYLPIDVRRKAVKLAMKIDTKATMEIVRITNDFAKLTFPRDLSKSHQLVADLASIWGISNPPPQGPDSGGASQETSDENKNTKRPLDNETKEKHQQAAQDAADEAFDDLDMEDLDEQEGEEQGEEGQAQGSQGEGNEGQGEGEEPSTDLDTNDESDSGDDDGDWDGSDQGSDPGDDQPEDVDDDDGNATEVDNGSSDDDGGSGDSEADGSGEHQEPEVQDAPAAGGGGAGPTEGELYDDLAEAAQEILESLVDQIIALNEQTRSDILNEQKSERFVHDFQKQMPHTLRIAPTAGMAVDSNLRMVSMHIERQLKQLRTALKAGWDTKKYAGRLNVGSAMNARSAHVRVFDKYQPSKLRAAGTEVVILLDQSGSMTDSNYGSPLKSHDPIVQCARAIWALKHAFDAADIRSTVLGFSESVTICFRQDEKVGEEVSIFPVIGGTDPTDAIREATRIFQVSKMPNKLLVLLTDGEFNDDACNRTANGFIENMNQDGVHTILFGIGPDYDINAHSDGQLSHRKHHNCLEAYQIYSPNEMIKPVAGIVKRFQEKAARG